MSIEAMVGSVDFHNHSLEGQVNGTLAKRSPGSTLKPFVYGLAIDEGLIHPHTLLRDSPTRFAGFTPENYDKQFKGPISAKNALIESRNLPAVDLQAKLRKTSFYQFLSDAEISHLQAEGHYGLALALGGGEVTMMELVRLYSVLANQGVMHTVNYLSEKKSTSGITLLSPESSYLVLDMLKDNPPPNAIEASIHTDIDRHIPWKTGTSWAFRDAWAVGISGPYIFAVWVGNFNGKGNNAFVGRSAAGPLLFSALEAILPKQPWNISATTTLENLNIKKLQFCSNTGDIYEKH